MSYIAPKDEFLSIVKGAIPGHRKVNIYGYSELVNTTESTLWPLGGNAVIKDTAQSLDIYSSDANDTLLGSGARTIIVDGIDGSGNRVTEIIEMNGVTDVPTVNFFQVVNRMSVLTAGGSGFNEGNIFIDDTTNNRNYIRAEQGASHSSWLMLPAGFFLTVTTIDFCLDLAKHIFLPIRIELPSGVKISNPPIIMNSAGKSDALPLAAPSLLVRPLSVIELRAFTENQTGTMSTSISCIIIDTNNVSSEVQAEKFYGV